MPGAGTPTGRRAESGRLKPIRVLFQREDETRPRVCRVRGPLRLGYGKDCDVLIDEEGRAGPDILLELQRVDGPVRLYLPVPPADLAERVNLMLDGTPLEDGAARDLDPGARLEIVDKETNKRYGLVVDPRPFWLFRPRVLAGVIAALALAGMAYGAYLYYHLSAARTEIELTGERLAEAERALIERISAIESNREQIFEAIRHLETLQSASTHDLRREFDRRLDEISERAGAERNRISQQDSSALARHAQRTRDDLAALRAEFSDRMVETYERLRLTESRLLESVAKRMEASAPEGEQFKRVFAKARDAVIFVHTRYRVKFLKTGETRDIDVFGSGFIAAPDGTALTSQHVLFPWRYDGELTVLRNLGLVDVQEDSVRWSAWLTGATVQADRSAEAPSRSGGWHSDSTERPLKFRYAPAPTTAVKIVSTPVGMVEITAPVPDATDVAVFQLIRPAAAFPSLDIAGTGPAGIEPLDEVLSIGYPFSRLDEGVANPQAVRGFVRRVGRDALELDSALHPGLSGGPVVDRDGRVVAMAMAQFQSEVYGMAVRARDLRAAMDSARTLP